MNISKYRGKKGWICPVCKQARNADGCDPCIPNLPGVRAACCGHGGNGHVEGYLYFENGIRIGMIVTSISYDDGRKRIEMPQQSRQLAWLHGYEDGRADGQSDADKR